MGDERVAQVGDPAGAGHALDGRADEVDRARRRRRDHDVDPLPRTIRIAAGIAVRFQGTFSSGTSRRRPNRRACVPRRASPTVPCSSSAGRRPRGPTYLARCTHACVGGSSSSSRCTHFGSSGASTCVSIPSAGQVRRRLQRALDSAAPGRREVQRDEQDLHGSQVSMTPLRSCVV